VVPVSSPTLELAELAHFSKGNAPSAVSMSWRTTLASSMPMKKTTPAPMMFGRKPSIVFSMPWIGARTWVRPRTWRIATRPNSQMSRDAIEANDAAPDWPLSSFLLSAGIFSPSLVKAAFTILARIHVTTRIPMAMAALPAIPAQSTSFRKPELSMTTPA
jgi:hypothetical protein